MTGRTPSKDPGREVLAKLIADGLSDKQLGARFGVSWSTVRHWRHLYGISREKPDGRKLSEWGRNGCVPFDTRRPPQLMTDTAIARAYRGQRYDDVRLRPGAPMPGMPATHVHQQSGIAH